MREPGNLSGVARVTFPKETGTFLISYMRSGSKGLRVLGELTIHVPASLPRASTGNTNETEGYSPRFRSSINKRHSITSLKESTRLSNCENDVTSHGASYNSLNDKL